MQRGRIRQRCVHVVVETRAVIVRTIADEHEIEMRTLALCVHQFVGRVALQKPPHVGAVLHLDGTWVTVTAGSSTDDDVRKEASTADVDELPDAALAPASRDGVAALAKDGLDERLGEATLEVADVDASAVHTYGRGNTHARSQDAEASAPRILRVAPKATVLAMRGKFLARLGGLPELGGRRFSDGMAWASPIAPIRVASP